MQVASLGGALDQVTKTTQECIGSGNSQLSSPVLQESNHIRLVRSYIFVQAIPTQLTPAQPEPSSS